MRDFWTGRRCATRADEAAGARCQESRQTVPSAAQARELPARQAPASLQAAERVEGAHEQDGIEKSTHNKENTRRKKTQKLKKPTKKRKKH